MKNVSYVNAGRRSCVDVRNNESLSVDIDDSLNKDMQMCRCVDVYMCKNAL